MTKHQRRLVRRRGGRCLRLFFSVGFLLVSQRSGMETRYRERVLDACMRAYEGLHIRYLGVKTDRPGGG